MALASTPFPKKGVSAWLRPYHIRFPPHKPRRLRTSPATKTRPPCAGSSSVRRRPTTLTALPNGRYVQVRMERMRQGLELAQRGAVTLARSPEDLTATVRSGNNLYRVHTGLLNCTCADYQKHLQACKHLLAVEVHLGALGLVSPVPEQSAAADPPTMEEVVNTAAVPTTASWPTSEAPASMNIQLKVGNMQLMYTARDTNDRDLQDRMTKLLPWLAEVMAACEANYEARQQAAKTAAVQAAIAGTDASHTTQRAAPASPARPALRTHQRHRPELVPDPPLRHAAAHQ